MNLTLSRWLERIERINPKTIDMGLARVRAVFDRLPAKPHCPVFIVGGTNGKGSTCAMLESILRSDAYRVGLYTSPHILRFNERIKLLGAQADDDTIVAAFEAVEAARGDVALTYFEYTTLAAFLIFANAELDAWVIEVGLGGRLDATNVLDADCAIVVSIGLDHQDYLGNTREAIAQEKMGIARKGKTLVFADPNPPSNVNALIDAIAPANVFRRSIEYSAQAEGPAQWTFHAPDGTRMALPYPALRGEFQIHNAACALAALHSQRARLPVRAQSIREGLLRVDWPGRFHVLPGRPTVVLDAAHNPHAASVLATALGGMGFHPETFAVFGMLNDKDASGVIAALKDRITQWHVVPTHGSRGRSAESVRALLVEQHISAAQIRAFENVADALGAAQKNALEADRIVVFGSFHLLSEAYDALTRLRSAAP
jgi:dihydrofolate synthase / folylpolyglutamate synthase